MIPVNVLEFELQRLLLESMTHDLGNLATTISFLTTRKNADQAVGVSSAVLSQVAHDMSALLRTQRAVVYGNLLGWSSLPVSRTASDWCDTFARCLSSLTNPGSQLSFHAGTVDIPSATEATLMLVTGACICHIEHAEAGHAPHEMVVSLDPDPDAPDSCLLRVTASAALPSTVTPPKMTGDWLDLALAFCTPQRITPVIAQHELEFRFSATFKHRDAVGARLLPSAALL